MRRAGPGGAIGENVGLEQLTGAHVQVAAKVGANAGLKIGSLVAGIVAGADNIEGWTCCGTARATDPELSSRQRGRLVRELAAVEHVGLVRGPGAGLSGHLGPVDPGLAGHRFALAGPSDTLFTDDAIALIHQVGRGIPERSTTSPSKPWSPRSPPARRRRRSLRRAAVAEVTTE